MDALRDQLQTTLGGRYTLQRELGGAGMSRVFLAEEPALSRRVVLKTLPAGPLGEFNAERFRREIAVIAGLQHPHIVPLLEGGDVGGLLYYTMPFVEGRSLRERLDQERELPVAEAVRLLRELADALASAHERGIVHRDLKPENVLLSRGHALLADFGVARALASAADDRLTATGTMLGTPRYMAPEQASDDSHVDHRADLYALGVIAYEMLTGRHPFEGRQAGSLLAAHATAIPDRVTSWRTTVSPALESLVMRLLEKRPADRPPNADAVVRELDAIATADTPTSLVAGAARTPRSNWRRLAAIGIVGAGVILLGYSMWSRRSPAKPIRSAPGIAVLPFENIGADTATEYFSDGITEELINALSRIEGLHVAARTSAFALKGRQLDARTIGDTLGVTTLLGGSVRRAGNLLRVRAELVNARDGYTLWSETYERQLSDVFAVQDEIARAIVDRLRLQRPAALGQAAIANEPRLEAYDLYLKGRFFWNQRTEDGLRKSVDLFKQSIARDSTFALAHAALADAYAILGTYIFIPPHEALPRSRAAAEQTLKLDSTLAEAHAALGFALFWHDRDWSSAEREFRRAIELNPSYPTAHHWYSVLLSDLSRHEEAVAEMRTAFKLDPLSPIIGTILGTRFLFAGQLNEALGQLQQTTEMHPSYPLALFWLGQTQQYLGDSPAALAAARSAVSSDTTNAMMHLGLARIYAVLGRRDEARQILNQVETRFAGRFSAVHAAWVHVALGDLTAAARWLERADVARDGWLHNLAVDPALKPALAEPRTRLLLQRLQLPRP